MQLLIQNTSFLSGKVIVPGSKSHCIRGLIVALLARGESQLSNFLDSQDTRDAMSVCQSLGAEIHYANDVVSVKSNGFPFDIVHPVCNTGNSGITTHFIMPLLGLRKNSRPITLECGSQMRHRPISTFVSSLRELGLSIRHLEKKGELPIEFDGHLTGGVSEVEGMTSQYLSALLIALPCAPNDSVVTVRHLQERPYQEMTGDWLTKQNIIYTHRRTVDTDTFLIAGNQEYHKFNAQIPGDFSSASNLIAAALLLDGCVEIQGIDMNDSQGDKRLLSLLQEMGADIQINPNKLIISGGRTLSGIQVDASDIPDLLPILSVIGTRAMGKMEIRNVAHARIKETDRIHSMTEGLTRLGAKVEEHADGMTIYPSKLKGNSVNGYDDHRTVMALSVAGLIAYGTTTITGSHAINKTFPTYDKLMRTLGAKMEREDAVTE